MKTYHEHLIAALSQNAEREWAIDNDHDRVRDYYERTVLKLGLEAGKDTYNVSSAKSVDGKSLPFDDYRDYGDNEYISRYYEDVNKVFHISKDFAFPGSKVGEDYQGLTALNWAMHLSQVQRSLQNSFTGKRSAIKSLRALPILMENGSLEEESYQHGRLYDCPDLQQQASVTNVVIDHSVRVACRFCE